MTHETATLERSVHTEIASAQHPDHPIRRFMHRCRAWVAEHPRFEVAYRVAVALVGAVLVLGGLVLVPLPGPGWLVVFLGLAVLGTEFHWAHRISLWLKSTLDHFWQWWRARRKKRAARNSQT